MNPDDWLQANAPGFKDLPVEDRQAIFHFSLLWSLFESTALDSSASARSILSRSIEWGSRNQLSADQFADSLSYFRNRYFRGGQCTTLFAGLNFRDNDNRELVTEVLSGRNDDLVDRTAALLIVVYRLRNNLFHGAKWAYELRNQRDNFAQANSVLVGALALES